MGIGASIFLMAVGAIIMFAVNGDVAGIDKNALGLILLIAGALGLLFTALIWGPRRRETVVDDAPVVRREVL
ncbi:MAG: DUF6458 family protein [Mycobacteriales bacterium]|nr:DUF6458 family protein [Frankia sp.]